MNALIEVNSKDYWDNRFATNWVTNQGKQQSAFFSRIALDAFPEWLVTSIREKGWTICDWGCALGDGTHELHNHFPQNPITGIDFSSAAIERAKEFYPLIRFVSADLLNEPYPEQYDVFFSSNTLEHFSNPWELLDRLSKYVTQHFVILIPYKEYDRYAEHLYSFDEGNIPSRLNPSFSLTQVAIINAGAYTPNYWGGMQVLLSYSSEKAIRENKLKPISDVEIRVIEGLYEQKELFKEIKRVRDQVMGGVITELRDSFSAYQTSISTYEQGLRDIQNKLPDSFQLLTTNKMLAEQLAEKELLNLSLRKELENIRVQMEGKQVLEERLAGKDEQLARQRQALTDMAEELRKVKSVLSAKELLEKQLSERGQIIAGLEKDLEIMRSTSIENLKKEKLLEEVLVEKELHAAVLRKELEDTKLQLKDHRQLETTMKEQEHLIAGLKDEQFKLEQSQKEILDYSSDFQSYIHKLEKQIAWYKVTFEERSVLGVIRSKLLDSSRKKG
jgi:hypothetical protein